jgi:ribonuclease PH
MNRPIVIGLILFAIVFSGFLFFLKRKPVETEPAQLPQQKEEIAKPSIPAVESNQRRINVKLFFNGESILLKAENRFVPYRESLRDQAFEVIKELANGPEGDLGATIPEGTEVRDLFVTKEGIAYVDFSSALADKHGGGSQGEINTVYSIVNTLTLNFPQIKRVQILMEDRAIESLKGHLDLSHPLKQDLSVVDMAPAQQAAKRTKRILIFCWLLLTLRIRSSYMRYDGRAPDQLRKTTIIPNYIKTADGSVLIEVGDTRVVCTAGFEDRVPSFLKNTGQGWLTSEYGMIPRSSTTRITREASQGKPSGRTQEIQRLVGRSLRSVADLYSIGERTIWIDCDVLQADGGTRTASITGGFVALALALNRMVQEKVLSHLPLRNYVAAVSVGIVNQHACLDLNFHEDSRAEVDMNVVCTGDGRFVEIQGTAEKKSFSESDVQEMLRLGTKGIRELFQVQHRVLEGAMDERLLQQLPPLR